MRLGKSLLLASWSNWRLTISRLQRLTLKLEMKCNVSILLVYVFCSNIICSYLFIGSTRDERMEITLWGSYAQQVFRACQELEGKNVIFSFVLPKLRHIKV